jgi:FtsP/CotA-like multicopper oxidase with cupredoxin domain
MKIFSKILPITFCLFSFSSLAKTYDLEVKKQDVFITGKAVPSITVNGQIPAPTLRFTEGEDVEIRVKNSMDESTSIHWHGILLDGSMDGVPGLNGFNGIDPHTTFTYKFKIRQAGTYWYHSHSNIQEQLGVYGSIVIEPKVVTEKVDRDYVIVLSDFTEENPNTIINNLKIDSGYYNYNKRTIFTFFKDIKKNGFSATLSNYMSWGDMRMDPTDLADVTKYHFLTNGKTSDQNWTGIFKKGEKVKLRFINASAMTIYDVFIPGLKMKFVEADGQPIKPFTADEFRFGVAETYDVIVEPKDDKTFSIIAQSIDRTGYARGTLALKEGMKGEIPKMRPRALLTMTDMKMDGMNHGDMAMGDDKNMEGMDHSAMGHDMGGMDMGEMSMGKGKSGWAEAGTPAGNKALSYSDLISRHPQKDLRQPTKEIEFRFGGTMNRYIWTINGEKFPKPTHVKFGERVRLKFINDTMMAHPIHLHGMFMQMESINSVALGVDGGQNMKWLPNKHTVIVPPAQTVSMLLTADEAGEWAFHCHLLYHMANGMMTSVSVDKTTKSGGRDAN